ncbi:tetratricopeptide repeat protein [Carboxylicivirga linearis]|uniref:Tetratricopeptide repeat protein n=1 Tax=Carboxylicivirga linearis TaxID=1628157 RepID=A0ABS5JV59_9BACT|nr:tetratricopeptide repeat protein [Carboxylicivirga linearis]MBS2098767.1 tetratricopeptide repeat protein [Carboxylicivirga linearis]
MSRYSNKKYLIIIVCLCVFAPLLKAKTTFKEDSLSIVYRNASIKEDRFNSLIKLIEHTRNYDHKKSILYGTQGEIQASNEDDIYWKARFQFENGVTHYYLSAYDKALDKYLKATNNFKSIDDYVNLIKCYNNIGMIYDRIEQYEKAVNYYQAAIEEFKQLDTKNKDDFNRFIPQLYNNIASAYNKLKQTDYAIEYYEKALQEAERISFDHILGAIYTNLGIIKLEQNNLPEAKTYLDRALTIRNNNSDTLNLAKTYNVLANYYLLNNQLDSSLWASETSLKISVQSNLLELQRASYALLFEVYEHKALYKEALQQHKNFKLISDSISNEHKLNRLAQLETSHELEQIETRNKTEQEKLKYKYTILLLLLTTLGTIAIVIAQVYKSQKSKLKKKYKLLKLNADTKDRELTTNVMQLVQNHQVITDTVKDLISLKKDANNKVGTKIQTLIFKLQSQSNQEIWNEFELRFNQVHNHFFDNLKKKHPTITTTEKRLCALLRLDMSSKEIAAITNQTIRGVEVARSRLRKRLGLTGKDINLGSYLDSF